MLPTRCTFAILVLTLAACGQAVGPDAPAPDGISFGRGQGEFGAFYADQQRPSAGAPLSGEFAVAVPDSLGGLVLLGYDGDTRNLFILQLNSDDGGTYACGAVENGPACHARVLENVREEDGLVQIDGRLDLTTGSLTLNEVGPDDVAGGFEGHFERTAGVGGESFDVVHGTILVHLLDGNVEDGTLLCLVELAVGGESCS